MSEAPPPDIERVDALVKRALPSSGSGAKRDGWNGSETEGMRMGRVGIGYDAHRLVTGRTLVLGGVTISSEKGLLGHSDGDVLLHAIADALLGAAGERDIGHLFPNSDPQWKGASSLIFLKQIGDLLHRQGWVIQNIDASLIAEAPKVGPYREAMRAAIGQALGIEPARIGIKATTNEGMGFPGRGEGMAAMAVASLEKA